MALLDNPEANFALSAGLLSGNLPQGLLGFGQAVAQQKQNAAINEMRQLQMDNMRQEIAQRKAQQAQAEREAQGLPGLFRSPQSMSPGAFSPSIDGMGPTMSPQDAPPASPGGFDLQGALRLGIRDPKRLAEFAALANIGKPKVARTVEVMRNGKPTLIQLDESGQEIGAGYDQWKAPVFQNLGGRTAAIDPVALQERGSFAQTMSPEGRDASARGWATVNQGAQRLALDANNAQAGKAPAGYRFRSDGQGLEFIPGGPADPNAAKKAAPTEFQGKAAMFGDRAAEADRIIGSLEGNYSPALINAKQALGKVWGVGGGLEAAGNVALPANAQKVEQAQRDFVNAVLRLESGAAIAQSEFDNASKQYFPQPGDSSAVIEQKAANRKRAIQGLKNNARTSGGMAQQPSTGGATASFADENDPLGLRK